MWVMFPTLPLKRQYKALAESYIWNAMGHFGPGSLKEKLKAEDLSHTYTYYADSTVAGTNVLFTFHLTENGVKNYDKILEHVFAYFNKIRKDGVNEKLISSMAALRQVEFDYQEKRPSEFDFVSTIAGATPSYNAEDLLTGGFIMDTPDPKLMVQVLNSIVPENMNLLLVEPSFKEADGNKHEKYYDFSYHDEPLDDALLAKLSKAREDELNPPPALKYVPTKTELIKESAGVEPKKLINQGRVELWWNGMGAVQLPKADINIKLGYSPEIVKRVDGNIIAAMHSRLVQSLLESPTDEMQMCGMSYSLSASSDGLSLTFKGFDQHIESLIQAVLPTVRDPKFTTQQFEMVRRQLLLDLEDITTFQPYQHAMEAFEIVTVNGHFSRAELIAMAKDANKVNPEAYKKFLGEVFDQAQMTLLYVGNIDAARAEKMTLAIEDKLGVSRKDKKLSHTGATQVLNPKEEVEVRMHNPLQDDPNHATLAAYQFGVPTMKERVHMALIGDIIERPVFEILRTEHQLGYVVAGYVALHVSTAEVRILVQGFREDPDAVDLLIENTLVNLTKHIADMDATEFAKRKKSVYTTLAQEDKTIKQEANRLWGPIWNQDYCFQKREFLLKYLQSPLLNSTAPVLEMWNKIVKPSKDRKKIVVKLFGESKLASNHTSNTTVFKMDIERPGVKVVTLVNSVDVAQEMKDEKYWPREMICKDPLK
jgi:insulysin